MGRWKQGLLEANITRQLRALHHPRAQLQLIPALCLLQRSAPALAALEISSILGARENILTRRFFAVAACGNCDSFACPRTSCCSVQHKETIIRIVPKLPFAGVRSLDAIAPSLRSQPAALAWFSHAELLGRNVKTELGWHWRRPGLGNVGEKNQIKAGSAVRKAHHSTLSG